MERISPFLFALFQPLSEFFDLPVEFVQEDIGEDGARQAALRRPG
jgi:hypothetical protein